TDKAAVQTTIDGLNANVATLNKKVADLTPATTTTDPTAEWKTYTNTTYSYSIKYPATLMLNNTHSESIFFSPDGNANNQSFYIVIAPTNLSLTDLIAAQKTSKNITGEQSITLNGVAAYEAVDLGITSSYAILAVKNGYYYKLIVASGNHDTLAANKAALTDTQKSMIASFKFTK
ncbi:MAG TPA: PsbP-related protein, partial [Patescibacteria group bacterium]|nr:PsbP-related protein [Patescibacteria group bacterium]